MILRPPLLRLLAALLALLGAAPAFGATVVALKPAFRAAPGAAITLADLATITGPEADSLARIEVLSAEALVGGAWRTVEVARIREALDHAGVNWSRVIVRGSDVRVRALEAPPAPQVAPAPEVRRTPVPTDPTGTVRALIPHRLGAVFGVHPSDLRLTFDPADADLLATPIAGRTVDLTPTGTGAVTPLRITIYERDRIVADGVARVGVEVRREVAIANRSLRRNNTIQRADIRRETRWTDPRDSVASPDEVVGAAVRMRLGEGDLVRLSDLVAPAAIERGDRVIVHAVSGSFVVRTEARALSDGAEGDVIEFEALDRSARRFRARVAGPGRAVLRVSTPAAPATALTLHGAPR